VHTTQAHTHSNSLVRAYVAAAQVPVVIKDVAGLVPGAYQGRGKGNAFLNDLCDADVFVHVIDASGMSDENGVIDASYTRCVCVCMCMCVYVCVCVCVCLLALRLTSAARAKRNLLHTRDPCHDVQWVQEEIHRWIFNNVRAKWSKCLRYAHNVCL